MKEHELMTADGVTLHYDEYGTGDKVIISAQAGFYPKGLQQRLAEQGYHVYCIDDQNTGISTAIGSTHRNTAVISGRKTE